MPGARSHPAPDSPAGYVGRSGLRELLARAVSECRNGRGGLLLLEGEAGIGKTRTLALLQELAGRAGLACGWGRCSEVPGAPALWPWAEVLGRLPGTTDFELPDAERDDERAQFQIFRAVTDALLAEASARPLLVLIDDVHAADLASLRLLAFLARETTAAPLLVAAACRQTDAPRDRAAREVLDDVRRRAHVARLEGLDEEEVARLAATVGGASVHGTVARALFERTLGNPLFATQLALALVASGRDLSDPRVAGDAAGAAPAGVAAVLRDRLHRLAESDLALLRRAAVFGREFDADLLETDGLESAGVSRALEVAAAAAVLEPVPGVAGRWRFPHVLFRDVLYDEQDPAMRQATHRAACAAIRARRDLEQDVWLTAAAHHAIQAATPADAGETRELARRAGDRALARCAHEDAIAWFDAALRAHELSAEDDGGAALLSLRLRLGAARWRAGQPDAARNEYARALELARRREDGDAFAEAAVGWVGRTDAVLGQEEQSAALLEEALVRLDPAPSRLRVDALTRLATALYFSPDESRRETVSREAIGCAESLGDAGALGYALTARRYLLARPNQLREREVLETRTLEVLEDLPEDPATVIARYQSIVSAFERGDFAAVDQHMTVHARLAERLQEPFLSWQAAALRATRTLASGDLDEGEALAHRARELGEQAGSPNAFTWFSGQLYGIRRAQGRLGELEPILADLETRYPDVLGYRFARAEASLGLGREAEVRSFLAAAGRHGFRDVPHDFNWPSVMAIASRCALALDDVESAEKLHAALEPARETCIVMPFGSLWDGAAALYLGQLAARAGRFDEARADLAAAADLHGRIGARAHLAETWLAEARVHAAAGARSDAGRLAADAAELFRALGMHEAEKRADALARPRADLRAPDAVHSWKRSGSGWCIRYGDDEATLRDSLGIAYLGALLAQPTEPLHVLDLTARRSDPATSDSGELLDPTARRQVRARMNELAAELDEAEARHDLGRTETLRAELSQLEEELARALGLGGRARRVGDPVERARKAVYNRIQAALKNLESELPELAQHLRHNVRTGRTCVYAPEARVSWRVEG